MSSLARYALGLLLTVVSLAPVLLASVRLRRRLLADWDGIEARVCEGVIALGLLTVALELTGIVGAFTRVGVVAGSVVVAAAVWLGAGKVVLDVRVRPEPDHPPRSSVAAPALAVVSVAVVGAAWSGWTIYFLGHGVGRVDSLWYHLPAAARFVQTGAILHLQYFDANPITVFYPFGAELFHAWGLLLYGGDLLSPILNLGWAGLALAAAAAIGRPYGRAPHCVVAVAIVLGGPGLVDTQPGSAYNDVVCIALLLCAVAMVVRGGGEVRSSIPAAIAAGLALGTKFTMIVPVLALAIGVVVIAARGNRGRQALTWAAGLFLLGGVWYLRNLVTVGNPLPSLSLQLGPLSLPSPHSTTQNFTVAQYLFDGNVWRDFFVPGLRRSLGPAWSALLLLAVAGALGALIGKRTRVIRLLGVVAIISGVAFLASPQALGVPGAPAFFVFNVRYAAPALVLSLLLLAVAPVSRGSWVSNVGLVVAAAVLAITELDPGIWPSGLGLAPFDRPLRGSSAILGALVGVALLLAGGLRFVLPRHAPRRTAPTKLAPALGLSTLLVGLVAGGLVAEHYAQRRYAAQAPLPAIYRWAQRVRNGRIGLVGFTEQYPLVGAGDSNYVQYIGASRPHRGFAAISGCREWREAVNRAGYRWVVVAPPGFPLGSAAGPEVAWTLSRAPAAAVIDERPGGPFTAQQVVLLRIDGVLDPAGCPSGR